MVRSSTGAAVLPAPACSSSSVWCLFFLRFSFLVEGPLLCFLFLFFFLTSVSPPRASFSDKGMACTVSTGSFSSVCSSFVRSLKLPGGASSTGSVDGAGAASAAPDPGLASPSKPGGLDSAFSFFDCQLAQVLDGAASRTQDLYDRLLLRPQKSTSPEKVLYSAQSPARRARSGSGCPEVATSAMHAPTGSAENRNATNKTNTCILTTGGVSTYMAPPSSQPSAKYLEMVDFGGVLYMYI